MTRWESERAKKNWMKQSNASKILLVEGSDDAHSIIALCEQHDLTDGLFSFYVCDNFNQALAKLDGLLAQQEHPNAIGIVLDVDDAGINARWDAIRNKPEVRRNYNLPHEPQANGTIAKDAELLTSLGMWLMPNNRDPGMLEDFLAHLVDPANWETAAEAADAAKALGVGNFKSAHRSKAIIHTFLAWQDEPGKPLGQSITSHALRPHTPIAISFTDWLKRLFNA